MKNAHFDLATWIMHVRMDFNSFQELDELIGSRDVRKQHLDRKYPLGKRKPRKGLISGPQLVRASVEGALDSAHATYRRQMIVVAATYFEAVVADFFTQLFLQKPQQMYTAIRPESDTARGMIPLHEIVAAKSREALLGALAETSAARMSGLPITRLDKRLTELSSGGLGSELRKRIDTVTSHRHRIVHENDLRAVTASNVKSAFKTVEKCANRLAEVAADHDVDVRWSAVVKE